MKGQEALKLREIIEIATASLDDKTASEGASLFPKLKQDSSLVSAGHCTTAQTAEFVKLCGKHKKVKLST